MTDSVAKLHESNTLTEPRCSCEDTYWISDERTSISDLVSFMTFFSMLIKKLKVTEVPEVSSKYDRYICQCCVLVLSLLEAREVGGWKLPSAILSAIHRRNQRLELYPHWFIS